MKLNFQINTISAFQFNQLVRYATLMLTGIVFAKSTLTQTEIGSYETFTFLAGAVSFFWLNGLQQAMLPLAEKTKNSLSQIFSAFVVLQVLSILAAFFLFFMQPMFSSWLLNGKVIPEIGLLMIFIIFSVPANQVEYWYLIEKKNKASLTYSTVSFAIQFILVAIPAILKWDIKSILIGLVISVILRYLWLWVIFISGGKLLFSKTFVKEYIKLGGPLVLATLLSGAAQFVDGFIVTSHFDEQTFAIFRYGARELPLALLLANALSNAMLPKFAEKNHLSENLHQLKKSVSRLMHFLFPISILLILISYPAFPLLFNPDFAKSATIFNIYLLLVISRLILPQTILNGQKIAGPIVTAASIELVLNVGISIVLVRYFGIAGVAFGTVIAYLIEKIYLAISVRKKLSIKISAYLPVKTFLLYSLAIIAIFVLTELFLKPLF